MSPNVEENSYAIKERKNASLKDGNSITINYTLRECEKKSVKNNPSMIEYK